MTRKIRTKTTLAALALFLMLTAAGCGETQTPDDSENTLSQNGETQENNTNAAVEETEDATPGEPQLTPEEYIQLIETDNDFASEHSGYTGFKIDVSTFSDFQLEMSYETSARANFNCSAFNADQSLETVLKCEIDFSYEDNQWVPEYIDTRSAQLIPHHALQLSDEELKPILETCLGYEIDEIPEYTVTTSHFQPSDEPYDEHYTTYCFYLINDQYTYGGITHTLELTFIAYENQSLGNDRIYWSGHHNWNLYDIGVKLSEPDSDLNYDWIEALLYIEKDNPLNFRFEIDDWNSRVSLQDGYYRYGYNDTYYQHELKNIRGIDTITPGLKYKFDPQEAETQIETFLMMVDSEWLFGNPNRQDAYTALLIGEPYEYDLKDSETGEIIPKNSIAIGFTDRNFALIIQEKAVKMPIIFFITYDGIYCMIPNCGIGGFTDNNETKTTTFNLVKLDVQDYGDFES